MSKAKREKTDDKSTASIAAGPLPNPLEGIDRLGQQLEKAKEQMNRWSKEAEDSFDSLDKERNSRRRADEEKVLERATAERDRFSAQVNMLKGELAAGKR